MASTCIVKGSVLEGSPAAHEPTRNVLMTTTNATVKSQNPPMQSDTSSSNGGAKLPHLIKWIKHRVGTSRKLSGRRSYTNEDVEGLVRLSSISKETLQSCSSRDSTSQDSSDTFSGHTIVSDSSLDAAEPPSFTHQNRNSTVLNCGVNSYNNNVQKLVSDNGVGINRTVENMPRIISHTVNQHNVSAVSSQGPDVSVCKHGYLINKCRCCMQLPPLPPGSERVLKELQRQSKNRLKSQSQVQFGSTGNISAGDNTATSLTATSHHRNSFHADMLLDKHHNFIAVTKRRDPELPSHGYHSNFQHPSSVSATTLTASSNGNFVVGHRGNAVVHTHAYPPRSLATSPEHVYEEIPGSFFQNDDIVATTIPHRLVEASVHQSRHQQQHNTHNSHSNQDKRNFRSVHERYSSNGPKHHKEIRPYYKHQNPVHANLPAGQSAIQLQSHEFYPQNMHCVTSTNVTKTDPANVTMENSPAKQSSPSRQVSLGNLDFGMAKECDGFLVVPLRDRNDKSSSENQSNRPPENKSNRSQQMQQHWIKEQLTNSNKNYSNETAPSVYHQQMQSSQNTENQAVLPQSDNTEPSNRGFHEANVRTVSQPKESNLNSDLDEKSPRFFQPIYAHARTQSVDAAIYSDHPEKYSHCKRCNRPHALYHGVSLCHSDVEDMRQELQYLDIAGLDKNKLRGASSVLSSHSILQNVATRRSAFAKYIPSYQKEEDGTLGGTNDNEAGEHLVTSTTSSNKADSESGVTMTDTYKRQSVSAESDYFSSNYNTSQSDTLSREFQMSKQQQRPSYAQSSSDRSNDTFSEYDIRPDGGSDGIENNTSIEYNYYLEKVKQNLEIKQEVQRIIRSSESERSDCEKGCSDGNFPHEDSISLTSVTSLSELSIMPTDESSASFVRSKVNHHKSNKGSPKSTKSHSSTVKAQLNPTADAYVSKMQRVRKPIRKKKKTSSKDIEYYKLPNFSGQLSKPSPDRIRHSEKSHISATETKASSTSSKSDREGTPTDTLHNDSPIYGIDGRSSEKLSCRVTDFKLTDMKKGENKKSPVVSRDVNKRLSVRATSSEYSTGESKGAGATVGTGSRGSVYSSHNQVNKNANNRLLSDLMRMNHDRQLFSFM